MNLNKLKYLTLRGNKLDVIADEAFQVFILVQFPFNSTFIAIYDLRFIYNNPKSNRNLKKRKT